MSASSVNLIADLSSMTKHFTHQVIKQEKRLEFLIGAAMANEIADLTSTNIFQEEISKKSVQSSQSPIEVNHQGNLKQTQTITEMRNFAFESCICQASPTVITKEGYTVRLRRTLSGVEAAVEDHRVPGLQDCSILPVVFAPGVCVLDLDQKPRLWQKHHLHLSWDEKPNQQVLFVGSTGLKGGAKECKELFCQEPVFECCYCGILSDLCYAHYQGTESAISTFVPIWNIEETVANLFMNDDSRNHKICRTCNKYFCNARTCASCHDSTMCGKCCGCRQWSNFPEEFIRL